MENNHLRIYDNVLQMIGSTPIIKINKLREVHQIKCQVYLKLEGTNPGGSVKDRIGLNMLDKAEKNNKLKKGQVVVECTSGNTGMGVVLTSVIRGFKPYITIPDKMSNEKINRLKALGAEVIVCPTEVDPYLPEGYKGKAKQIAEDHDGYFPNQYVNQDNPDIHYTTTGPEIYEQMEGKLDYFVATVGTGGTITGCSRYLKEKDQNIKIVGVDPIGSSLALPESLNVEEGKMYRIEGTGQAHPTPSLDRNTVDYWVKTDDAESFVMAREIMQYEGLFVGGSCGSALLGAFRYLKQNKLDQDENIRVIVIMPDNTTNYLSRFMKIEWMVGCGFEEPSQLSNKDHLLYKYTAKDFSFLHEAPLCKTDQKMSLQEALDHFERGLKAIPIVENNKITSCIEVATVQKLAMNKKLNINDDVKIQKKYSVLVNVICQNV